MMYYNNYDCNNTQAKYTNITMQSLQTLALIARIAAKKIQKVVILSFSSETIIFFLFIM